MGNLGTMAMVGNEKFLTKLIQVVKTDSAEAEAIAANQKTPVEILEILSESRSNQVRQNVVNNNNVTENILTKLAADRVGSIRSVAIVKLMKMNTVEANNILLNLNLTKITKLEAEQILQNLVAISWISENGAKTVLYLFKASYRADTAKPFVYDLVKKWTEKLFSRKEYETLTEFINVRNSLNLKNGAVVDGLINGYIWVSRLVNADEYTWTKLTNILVALPTLDGSRSMRYGELSAFVPIFSAHIPPAYLTEVNRLTNYNLKDVKKTKNYRVNFDALNSYHADEDIETFFKNTILLNMWLADTSPEIIAKMILKKVSGTVYPTRGYIGWFHLLVRVLNNENYLTIFKTLVTKLNTEPNQWERLADGLVSIGDAGLTKEVVALFPVYTIYSTELYARTWQTKFNQYVAGVLENEPVETLVVFQQMSPTFTGTMDDFLELIKHV